MRFAALQQIDWASSVETSLASMKPNLRALVRVNVAKKADQVVEL